MMATKAHVATPIPSASSIEESVFHASSDGVLALSTETGAITAVNPSLLDLTGYVEAEIVGRHVSILWPDSELDQERWTGLVVAPGLHEEVPVRCRDGALIVADVKICTATLRGEGVTLCLVRDLSVRRELERELIEGHIALRKAYETLEQTRGRLVQAEKMATVGRFAAGVAHEINNPAAFVLANVLHLKDKVPGLVQLAASYRQMVRGGLDVILPAERARDDAVAAELLDSLTELVEDTVEGVRRIRNISRQLRTFSHTASGQVVMVDVNEVLRSSVKLLGRALTYRGRVVEDLARDLPRIACREGSLEQVLTNLLVNAGQAMSSRAPERAELRLATRLAGDRVVIEVTDTGPGIPEELLSRVFDPFFTTKKQGEGTGLGLALSQEIAAQHGGRIEVRSVVGEGTTMVVTIPVDTGLRPADRRLSAPPAPLSARRRARVLVIDDEVHLLRSLRRVLSARSDVTVALGGRPALELLERDADFDVVLLDVIMPDVDGIRVYEHLKEHHPALAKRLVFMTGGTCSDMAREIPGASAEMMLQKPFDTQQLVRLVDHIAGLA